MAVQSRGDRPQALRGDGRRIRFRLAGRELAVLPPRDCDLTTMDPEDASGYIWRRYGHAIQALVPEARRPSV